VWQEVAHDERTQALVKPNSFQSAAQFREYWIATKLIHGNVYVLKRRDKAGRVTALYVLDSERVMPMVSDAGEVYYQLYTDALNTLPEGYLRNIILGSAPGWYPAVKTG